MKVQTHPRASAPHKQKRLPILTLSEGWPLGPSQQQNIWFRALGCDHAADGNTANPARLVFHFCSVQLG